MWQPGDRLRHRFNPELGAGVVEAVEGRGLTVRFPQAGETLRLAASTDVLEPLALAPGSKVTVGDGERSKADGDGAAPDVATVAAVEEDGRYRLDDGRVLALERLWPVTEAPSALEMLERGEVGALEDFRNRLDGMRLQRLRQADGLGSFLGGRIELYAHQLHTAEQACAEAPVRWLLADEVGLGKTVEACLIMNRLIHTGRVRRTLVVAPETLVVQWLGELWRKHHQIFVLLDDKRLADVRRDYGANTNPFEVHPKAIVALELLEKERRLAAQAAEAGIDLLVVDEAHRLRRPPGHPGEPAYRAVAEIAERSSNVLLLTGTPLEDDAHGFFRLLQLLRPEALPEDEPFEARLARREPLPPCISAARRADVGGLPPRAPRPIELDDADAQAGWHALEALHRHLRARPAGDAVAAGKKSELLARALSSPAAVLPRLSSDDEGRALAAAADEVDPRLDWLVAAARRWHAAGEKVLVFVAYRETLERLRKAIERRAGLRAGIFHEDLSMKRRDIEVAQFRLEGGPPLLISTECGGEGRNFTFCHRLVLYDLPWSPALVEQRIGRLDRIGRTIPTEIVYFRPPAGGADDLARAIVDLYEAIGLFREPLGGLARELRRVERAVVALAIADAAPIPADAFAEVLAEAHEAHDRVRQAAFDELYRERYRPEMAPAILARVPPELERLTADVVLRAAARFGFGVEQQRAEGAWLIEFGAHALVDHLPGVDDGSRFLGTFDRALAVEDESLDFFASGHPLVEGILAELEDGRRGRAAAFALAGIDGVDEETFGLLAIYGRGVDIAAVVVDRRGARRDDLLAGLLANLDRARRVDIKRWARQRGWRPLVRRLAEALPSDRELQAIAAFRVGPRRE